MIGIIIGSFLASLGFGILFNIKGKNLILAGIGGSIGGFIYQLSMNVGLSELYAMFFASVMFSLYSEILARICKTPVTTFIICAMIPLVPGGGMYRMMLQAIHGNVMDALTIGLDTLTVAGVLALGILMTSTMMRSFYRKKKRKSPVLDDK